MAEFTSVQTGNWNDGATWGNDSPGVKGTDWPGNAGDTFTVDTGHTVSYNVSETNELGASTIDGTLSFISTSNTKLTFGNVSLTVSATGSLEIGTSGTPIPAAYNAELIFNTTSDNAQGLSITDGGSVSMYGDASYVSSFSTTLADDAENTDADVYIKTVDDMSAIWHIGDEITVKIENMGDGSSYTDAVRKRTIVGFSGTTIELDEVTQCQSGVGDTWISPVEMVTRNVKMYKYGAVTDIASSSRYNSNRPYLVDNTTGANTNVFSNVQLTGLYRITCTGGTYTNCIVRNGETGFRDSDNNTVSGNIYSCYYGFYYSDNNTVSGNIYSCTYGFRYSDNSTVSGNIYSCTYGFDNSSNSTVSGSIGYDSGDNSLPNTYDLLSSKVIMHNCKLPAAGLSWYDRNTIGGVSKVLSSHDNRTLNSFKTYQNTGETIKTPCDDSGTSPSVDPDSGNGDCIEVSNLQSNLSVMDYVEIFNGYEYGIYAQASINKTYKFYIQSMFTSTLANTEISLEGKYMAGSDGALTLVTSTETVATRGSASDWTQYLSLTINPAQTGFVFFRIKLMKYESGKKIYIWPEAEII